MVIKQYEIILVNLNPTVGSEIRKIRPCVVVSPVELNRNLTTLVIAPMTTTIRHYPTRVKVFFEGKEGHIAIDQIRTIDSKRVIKSLGELSTTEKKNVKKVIRQTFVD